jgi:hypothetical protein
MDPTQPIMKERAAKWLLEAEQLAELPKLAGPCPAHSRLPSAPNGSTDELAEEGLAGPFPLILERVSLWPDMAQAGSWRSQETLARCYQQPDDATMLTVVQGEVQLRKKGVKQAHSCTRLYSPSCTSA